jgi:hypothetical protein
VGQSKLRRSGRPAVRKTIVTSCRSCHNLAHRYRRLHRPAAIFAARNCFDWMAMSLPATAERKGCTDRPAPKRHLRILAGRWLLPAILASAVSFCAQAGRSAPPTPKRQQLQD